MNCKLVNQLLWTRMEAQLCQLKNRKIKNKWTSTTKHKYKFMNIDKKIG